MDSNDLDTVLFDMLESVCSGDKTVGSFIKERREALGMSVQDLSKTSDVSVPTILELERNCNAGITMQTVNKLARAIK